MIELNPSVPHITTEERQAFAHNLAVFSALKTLRSYGFNVNFEGIEAPRWPNDAKFERDNPGMGVWSSLDEISQSN
jgi:hypothetical protein